MTGTQPLESDVLRGEIVLNDHLGSPRLRLESVQLPTDVSGWMPKNPMDYTPFGRELALFFDSKTTPDGYTGKPLDTTFGLQAMNYGARFYDPRLGRWWQRDPLAEKYTDLSPYNYVKNNPIKMVDPDGRDAKISVCGNMIMIDVIINAYGSGATKEWVKNMQEFINNDWNNGGRGWKFVDDATKKQYRVRINTTIKLYNASDPTEVPSIIPESWKPRNRENYVQLVSSEKEMIKTAGDAVSFVRGGDEGVWRAYGNDPSSHEFGHLLGLKDRYSKNGANSGWNGNVMAEAATQGIVEKKNINAIVKPVIDQYNSMGGEGVFETEIDVNRPSN